MPDPGDIVPDPGERLAAPVSRERRMRGRDELPLTAEVSTDRYRPPAARRPRVRKVDGGAAAAGIVVLLIVVATIGGGFFLVPMAAEGESSSCQALRKQVLRQRTPPPQTYPGAFVSETLAQSLADSTKTAEHAARIRVPRFPEAGCALTWWEATIAGPPGLVSGKLQDAPR
jgi:hypothetical protein